MSIQIFANTLESWKLIDAIDEPKDVWIDGEFVRVYTGDDYTERHGVVTEHVISVSDFRSRFTDAELAAISMLAYSGVGDANAAVLLLKISTASEGVDLSNPQVLAGFDYLVSKGRLTAARAFEILK